MKIIVKNNEIVKLASILANNNFTNVNNKNNLINYLYIYLSNYYMLSIEKDFICKLKYTNKTNDTNYKDYTFLNIVSDYNFLFKENIDLKKENIDIIILKGDDCNE